MEDSFPPSSWAASSGRKGLPRMPYMVILLMAFLLVTVAMCVVV
jgi:hypothetical protein